MIGYVDRLRECISRKNSLVCVGLDIDPARIPDSLRDSPDWVVEFNRGIIDATAELACAYKPNMAFYEALGSNGLDLMKRSLETVPRDVVVIGDGKRGDIGHTAAAYARALFEGFGFDAVTVNPYLGRDSVEPFLAYQDRGVYLLCKTSNPGSGDFQNLMCSTEEGPMPLYRAVALRARSWNSRANVGLVVGATYPEELREVRTVAPDLPLLIPGVGTQAGDLESTVRQGAGTGEAPAVINSSRAVIYASSGRDWKYAARDAATKLRDSINTFRQAS